MTWDIMRKFGAKSIKAYYLKHDDCTQDVQSCRIDEFKIPKQEYIAFDYTVVGCCTCQWIF